MEGLCGASLFLSVCLVFIFNKTLFKNNIASNRLQASVPPQRYAAGLIPGVPHKIRVSSRSQYGKRNMSC